LPQPLKRILLVEDDPDIQEMASLALVAVGGYAVEVCGTAREALDRAPVFGPDLILLDVMMPGTDGPGALKALREIDATARTPVVFMTARVGRQDIAQYDALGCLGVIAKPFDPVVLPRTLEGIWGRHVEAPRERHRKEFEALARAYAAELTGNVDALQATAAALAKGGWDRPTAESLYRQAHRMAGSAGVYGLERVGLAAGILEDLLKGLLEDPTWPPARSPAELHTVVKAVGQAARRDARRARARASSS
jgi:two-component system, OmpR family, response regulator